MDALLIREWAYRALRRLLRLNILGPQQAHTLVQTQDYPVCGAVFWPAVFPCPLTSVSSIVYCSMDIQVTDRMLRKDQLVRAMFDSPSQPHQVKVSDHMNAYMPPNLRGISHRSWTFVRCFARGRIRQHKLFERDKQQEHQNVPEHPPIGEDQ